MIWSKKERVWFGPWAFYSSVPKKSVGLKINSFTVLWVRTKTYVLLLQKCWGLDIYEGRKHFDMNYKIYEVMHKNVVLTCSVFFHFKYFLLCLNAVWVLGFIVNPELDEVLNSNYLTFLTHKSTKVLWNSLFSKSQHFHNLNRESSDPLAEIAYKIK